MSALAQSLAAHCMGCFLQDVRAGEKDPDFVSASETAEQADDPHTKTLSDYEKEKSS